MSDTRAYVKYIDVFGAGPDENNSIHQSSPEWVLTFVRWQNRDTFRVPQSGNPQTSPTATRDLLVVENDCIAVNTFHDKNTLNDTMSATLVMSDINYETAVAPGDFVFVNMLNWPSDARRVADQARAKAPINGIADGFKGFFKVQSVRRTLVVVNTETGAKAVLFKIQGQAFTEFNNTIYFNPYLLDPNQDPKNRFLYTNAVLGNTWKNFVNEKGLYNVQDIVALLIQSLIGTGIDAQQISSKQSLLVTQNVHFYIPQLVGQLMGVPNAQAAKDVYNYLFGIQSYSAGGATTSLAVGMNPNIKQERWPRFFYTYQPCPGNSFVKPEFWNQVKTWAILNQYSNSPINELYSCFKVDIHGSVMPTVVFRQIPFTTSGYSGPGVVTQFLTLPRWKVNPALIFEQDIGRDEAARINFVQYFGRSTVGKQGSAISAEISAGNFAFDLNDVQRSGLRPYVVNTQFDEPTPNYLQYQSPTWAQILGDALIGGHMKMNGSFNVVGIQDPISVGDNWEFDGTVYHIEQLTHMCNISPEDGKKRFRTLLQVSSGVDISSSTNGVRYPEMSYPNAYNERAHDSQNNQILPGVSESQDSVYRTVNPDASDNPAANKNTPFIQPNTSSGGQTYNGSDT